MTFVTALQRLLGPQTQGALSLHRDQSQQGPRFSAVTGEPGGCVAHVAPATHSHINRSAAAPVAPGRRHDREEPSMTETLDESDLVRRLSAVDEAIRQAQALQGLLSSVRYEVWNDLMTLRSRANDSTPRCDHCGGRHVIAECPTWSAA